MPLFDYEQMLYQRMLQYKYLWILKATGLGVTEFVLRFMIWLATKDDTFRDTDMCIVTGPRIEQAIEIINRMKRLFTGGPTLHIDPKLFDTKETVLELNGVHIQAYPSNHLDAAKGIAKVSIFYLDEADFFPPGQ
jgi:hypothetical protein